MGRKGTQHSSASRWARLPELVLKEDDERRMPLTDDFVDDGRLTASIAAQILRVERSSTSSSD